MVCALSQFLSCASEVAPRMVVGEAAPPNAKGTFTMLKRTSRADVTEPAPRLVPLRTTLVGMVLAGLLAGVVVAAVERLALGAPAGPEGPEGPPGPAGDAAELEPSLVWDAIAAEPERLAELLDPTPSELDERDDEIAGALEDVAGDVEQVRSDVAQVADDLASTCGSLSLTDALSSEVLSCP